MRRARALAAAALALLALGAASCKPSSLTPFGIGTRGPDDTSGSRNGEWSGVNATGRLVQFNVGNESVVDLLLLHQAPGCRRTFEYTKEPAVIEGDAFAMELFYPQGRFVLNGTFTSPTTCSGTYFFEGLNSGGPCPTRGTGSFVAGKIE